METGDLESTHLQRDTAEALVAVCFVWEHVPEVRDRRHRERSQPLDKVDRAANRCRRADQLDVSRLLLRWSKLLHGGHDFNAGGAGGFSFFFFLAKGKAKKYIKCRIIITMVALVGPQQPEVSMLSCFLHADDEGADAEASTTTAP